MVSLTTGFLVYFLHCLSLSSRNTTHLFYGVYSSLFEKRTKRVPQRTGVSVIVCAHDEEKNLRDLIPVLLAQDYPEFEVVIVDDRSNDSTFDLLLAETAKDHRLRMVHVNRTPPHANNKKYALTLGIKASRYEWILLTDADCRPSGPGWISTMSSYFDDDTDFVLGYSPYLRSTGILNSFIRFEALLTGIQYISFALLGHPYMGVGRNLAYRRSKFLEGKGFSNILHVQGGDDDLYVNRYATKEKTSVCIGGESITCSIPEISWQNFFRQKVRHLSVGRRYRLKHRFFLGLFTVSWLVTWFAGVIFLSLLVHPLVVAGLLALRVVVVATTVQIASKKLGEEFERWTTPLLDFIYAFYYLVIGLRTLVTKKVRWKN